MVVRAARRGDVDVKPQKTRVAASDGGPYKIGFGEPDEHRS
jgi:hypothetical protein